MEIKKLVKKAIKSRKISDLEAAFKHADQDGPEPVQLLIDSDWISGHDWFRQNGNRTWIDIEQEPIELDFCQLARRNELEFAWFLIEHCGIIPSTTKFSETLMICITNVHDDFLELLLSALPLLLTEWNCNCHEWEVSEVCYELDAVRLINECVKIESNKALDSILKNITQDIVFSGKYEHESFLRRFRREPFKLEKKHSKEDVDEDCEDADLTSSQLRLLALICKNREWQVLTELSSKFDLSEFNRFAFFFPRKFNPLSFVIKESSESLPKLMLRRCVFTVMLQHQLKYH